VVLEGDDTGQELLDQAIRVLHASVTGVDIPLTHFDLGLANRRATNNKVIYEAGEAMRETGFGFKAATTTPVGRDDVGSPNAILRKEIGGTVIVRTGRKIPGVMAYSGLHAPISVVRMAVNDAYGATEWREGSDIEEQAFRTEMITRRDCRAVAEYAFRLAERDGSMVFGGPKFTVSPIYEGMLKEEMDAAHNRHPNVPYRPELIDATFALLLTVDNALVIPSLNRDGDLLSDLIMQLFGSIAGAESLLLSFDDEFTPKVVMAEAPHGTAPSLAGKDVANPMAMILAAASLLSYFPNEEARNVGAAIRAATLETVEFGIRTVDIGGDFGTTAFTNAVIARTRERLAGTPIS
jgi:isocitrate/isopropylmalate dehydrogenase